MFDAVLSDKLRSDRNSFNLVRLFAASAVIVSHLSVLKFGPGTPEPLSASTPFTLGQHAVNLFFVLSGLMLSRSLERDPDLLRYASSRALRLAPALLAFGLVFALAAGPLLSSTSIAEYLANVWTWTYPLSVLVQFERASPPPGLFLDTPFAKTVNDPLWTLKYEVAAYAMLGVVQALGLRRSLPILSVALVSSAVAMIVAQKSAEAGGGAGWPYQLSRYGFCFLLGMLTHRLCDRLPVAPILLSASFGLAIAVAGTSLSPVVAIVAVAHVAIVAGSIDYGVVSRWSRRNDLSYGTYIYGWPVQQAIMTVSPGLSLTVFAFWLFLSVLPLAFLSWSVIERPALNYKSWKIA
ncbi:MAG: acyltransferase family protein [Hyphomicrobiales bacterium]|nr:acyltransferase family protein [Hyphomicrobiales bacterium]